MPSQRPQAGRPVYVGVYGGTESGEGVLEDDQHDPRRSFSWRTDELIQQYARESIEIVDFHVVLPVRIGSSR